MTNNNPIEFNHSNDESINLRKAVEEYFYYWKWFLLSVIVALLIAFIYLRYATKEYAVDAKILLSEKQNVSSELAAFGDASSLLGEGTNAVVADQIDVLKSRRLMHKVVQKHNLNKRYFHVGRVKESESMEVDSPVKISFLNDTLAYNDNFRGSLTIKIVDKNNFSIEESTIVKTGNYKFGQKINSKLESFILLPNKEFEENIGNTIRINIQPMMSTVNYYRSRIKVEPNTDKKSMVVNFGMVDNLKPRAQLVVNSIIDVYNNDLNSDTDRLTKATTKFINDRLALVTNDLKAVDKDLEIYKSSNNITDVSSEANIFLQNAADNDKKVLEYTTQLQIADYVSSAVNSGKNELLPSNVGIQDATIASQINKYNELMMEKQDLLKSMTNENPSLQPLNESIKELRQTIRQSLGIYRRNMQTALGSVQSKQGQINTQIKRLPAKERGFRDISRQQQIVEALYLFLLQKREEAEIKSAATPDNIKIIDHAYGTNIPVSPKKNIIYLGALILGSLLPFAILYLSLIHI